ncbi:hypothetical protein DRP07_10450 [Archaeoglobales archaeon]|nr:MAG: hypothetical protein DRP07_10450 [Archaeoglobales archaeon]
MMVKIPIVEREIKIKGRTIIYRVVPKKGWAIVIKEDNVLIDHYHHSFPHIHPERDPIKYEDVYEVVEIVIKHIEKYGEIKLEKLRDELCR